jgi:hypothetical protein
VRAALALLAASTALLAGCTTVSTPTLVTSALGSARPVDGPTREQYYGQRWADILKFVPDLYSPAPTPVRTIADDRWLSTIMVCVAGYGQPPDQPNAYAISELVCEIQYPSASGFEVYRSAADRAATYNYYMHTLMPCLTLLGQPILPSPAYRMATSGDLFFWPVHDPLVMNASEQYRFDRCPAPSS